MYLHNIWCKLEMRLLSTTSQHCPLHYVGSTPPTTRLVIVMCRLPSIHLWTLITSMFWSAASDGGSNLDVVQKLYRCTLTWIIQAMLSVRKIYALYLKLHFLLIVRPRTIRVIGILTLPSIASVQNYVLPAYYLNSRLILKACYFNRL